MLKKDSLNALQSVWLYLESSDCPGFSDPAGCMCAHANGPLRVNEADQLSCTEAPPPESKAAVASLVANQTE